MALYPTRAFQYIPNDCAIFNYKPISNKQNKHKEQEYQLIIRIAILRSVFILLKKHFPTCHS